MNLSIQSVFTVISAVFLFLFSSVASSTTIIDTKKEPDVLDLVFILDKSGSMSGFETDTIGGYNSVLTENKGKKQKPTLQLFYLMTKQVYFIIENPLQKFLI
ncbi:hypothetical protein AB6H32_19855 [Providencia hangzhouensis]